VFGLATIGSANTILMVLFDTNIINVKMKLTIINAVFAFIKIVTYVFFISSQSINIIKQK
ncbi:MAG: hypothetical protein WBZ20_09170, partial [Nitrososphaeraceae archaeon]